MSEHAQQPEHKPPFDLGRSNDKSGRDNPWLVPLGAVAVLTLMVGIIMYSWNQPGEIAPGDAGLQLIGTWLIGAGVIAGALFMTAEAVCWQLRRS